MTVNLRHVDEYKDEVRADLESPQGKGDFRNLEIQI